MPETPNQSVRFSRRNAAIAAGLAIITFALYAPAIGYEFNNYDDAQYITSNARIHQGLTFANIRWAFQTGYAANWHPLTWLSHILDCQFFGLNPAGHHFTSILFHTANAVLFFLLWRGMTGCPWRSAFVAALFAWHPTRVESVTFIAERKDVLSTFFGLATLWAYWAYVRAPSFGRRASVLLLFALALMSKPMLVSLPLLMLLLDYWPLRREPPFKQLFLEKLPLLALSAVSSLITIWAQKRGGAMASSELPISTRTLNALNSYVSYLGRLFVPRHLIVFYPYKFNFHWPVVAAETALLLGISVVAIYWARRRPWFAVGWFWFIIALIPVIGLVQVGEQAMADRYTYLPAIGIFILVTWTVGDVFAQHQGWEWPMRIAWIIILAACLPATSRQLSHWRNSITLFSHALAVDPDNPAAQCNLAQALDQQGDEKDALEHYSAALRLKPNYPEAECNLGLIAYRHNDLDGAVKHFTRAIEQMPAYAVAHYDLGLALAAKKQNVEAQKQYRAAVDANPDYDRAWANLGLALLQQGNVAEATTALTRAVDLAPNNFYAQNGLAHALEQQGKASAAVPHYQSAATEARRAGDQRLAASIEAHLQSLQKRPDASLPK